jgi:hypothetical protein
LCRSESDESRRIVGHGVSLPFQIVLEIEAGMVPLVDGSNTEEFGRRAGSSSWPFAGPAHGSQVVGGVLRRTLTDVEALGGALLMEEAASELEVWIVDVPCGVVEGHETVTNVLGEDDAP